MNNLNNGKYFSSDSMFDDYFLSIRTMYLSRFNKLPNRIYISRVNGEKACNAFKEKFGAQITNEHEYNWFNHSKKQMNFGRRVLVLNNECIIQFGDDHFELLHNISNKTFADEAIEFVKKYKERQRKQPLEINLVVKDGNGLDLKAMEIKRTKLDIDLFYEDDFKATDEIIRARLNKKNDKGIVLLHGLPGTGKTTYLRHLIGKIKKRVLFLSPSTAGNLMNPEFIDLLIDNPNSVLIIEDAENIIMDRKVSNDSSVSNLLNISDGLLADFLNVQLICTFNSSLTLIDSALMRKGRLIAKYEFGKLSAAKAQRLSNHLGFKTFITKPMTVAEIANQHEHSFETDRKQIIGFRKHQEEELMVSVN